MTAQPTRAQLRALADKATPGPWEDGVDDLTDMVNVHHDGEYRLWVADCGAKDDPHARADAEFIAAARTALPHLLDQLDRAEAERQELAIALDLALVGEEVQTSERYSNATALAQAVIRADQAEARIKAVEDALDKAILRDGTEERELAHRIRRAMEGCGHERRRAQ